VSFDRGRTWSAVITALLTIACSEPNPPAPQPAGQRPRGARFTPASRGSLRHSPTRGRALLAAGTWPGLTRSRVGHDVSLRDRTGSRLHPFPPSKILRVAVSCLERPVALEPEQ
jgi:hypothetical protein